MATILRNRIIAHITQLIKHRVAITVVITFVLLLAVFVAIVFSHVSNSNKFIMWLATATAVAALLMSIWAWARVFIAIRKWWLLLILAIASLFMTFESLIVYGLSSDYFLYRNGDGAPSFNQFVADVAIWGTMLALFFVLFIGSAVGLISKLFNTRKK